MYISNQEALQVFQGAFLRQKCVSLSYPLTGVITLIASQILSPAFLNATQDMQDPLRRLSYKVAFDHTEIDRKYAHFLNRLGCAENCEVADTGKKQPLTTSSSTRNEQKAEEVRIAESKGNAQSSSISSGSTTAKKRNSKANQKTALKQDSICQYGTMPNTPSLDDPFLSSDHGQSERDEISIDISNSPSCGSSSTPPKAPSSQAFTQAKGQISTQKENLQPPLSEEYRTKLQEEYEETCLDRLYQARRKALLAPATESAVALLLIGWACAVVLETLGTGSYGGSMSILAASFNSIPLVGKISASLYNWYYPPTSPVDELEERFAKTQCYIPRKLWPILNEKFTAARQNYFTQRENLEFIDFTLGLTVFKPKVKIDLSKMDIDDGQQLNGFLSMELEVFLRTYFNDQYENFEEKEYYTLKANIHNFLKALLGKGKVERYLYLYGPGGIGKTEFVNQLNSFINNLFPGSVNFEKLVITSPEELEGSQAHPGTFLSVLWKQCLTGSRGSLVLLDEASWLNEQPMLNPAKRIFNGKFAEISTKYFGKGREGSGISFVMPPMLIVAAANSIIEEAALRSRFDTIHFPSPKKKALKDQGQNNFTKNMESATEPNLALLDALDSCNNFREVHSVVASMISKTLTELNQDKVKERLTWRRLQQ